MRIMSLSKKGLLLLLVLLFFSASNYLLLAGQSAIEMVEIFFTEDNLQKGYFTEEVLAQVSVTDIKSIRNDYTENLGKFLEAEKTAQHLFKAFFEKGIVEIQLVVNGEGKIAGLYFLSVSEYDTDLNEIVKEFAALPGKVSLLLMKDDEELISLNPEEKMAVGSTFKLAVLKTLKDEIEMGNAEWSDYIELEEANKSLPSGYLQEWPAGSPLTLHTLATLMISVSDNTATDVLIDYLGRDKIEAVITDESPFLKTREAIILKDPENKDILEKYRQADSEEKYEILSELVEKPLPSANIFDRPRALDIEWYFTAYELKELMNEVEDLDLMGINPGLARSNNWKRVAYKGGSEPGVFNLASSLKADDGSNYFITASWNDEKVLDEDGFVQLYLKLISMIKEDK
ncbi:MAG: serine hydrolase [bacterium]